MKDTLSSNTSHEDNADLRASFGGTGMRHSIRPRRNVLMQAEQRQLAHTFEAAPAVDVRDDVNHLMPEIDAPRWQDLSQSTPGPNADLPLANGNRDSGAARAFDLLRTRLRQTTLENGWVNIAVTAPTSRCGNTFTAVNLALSLARVPGSRTVLMDMNMRGPGIARAFDLQERGDNAPGDMADFLTGRVPMGRHLTRVSDTLALGLNHRAHPTPAEILQDSGTAETLTKMRAALRPQIVIYDMPAMLSHDDVSAFLPQLDGVLLVSDGTQTMARHLVECEKMLDGQVPLLGVVLNRARASSIPHYS